MRKETIQTVISVLSWSELSAEQQQLLDMAKKMTFQSYCPYSGFNVGAAALLADGSVVTGSNQENAAYPSGLCAERTALFAANANRPDQPVKILAIACRTRGSFTSKPGSPCGSCRQVMIETEHRYGVPMQVLLYGEQDVYVINSASDLLPFGFFSEDLNR
jgi:cytidine deaminase